MWLEPWLDDNMQGRVAALGETMGDWTLRKMTVTPWESVRVMLKTD